MKWYYKKDKTKAPFMTGQQKILPSSILISSYKDLKSEYQGVRWEELTIPRALYNGQGIGTLEDLFNYLNSWSGNKGSFYLTIFPSQIMR